MTEIRIEGVSGPRSPQESVRKAAANDPGFGEMLEKMVADVNRMQHRASESVRSLASGEVQDLHQVMIEMNKAEIGFRFLLEVRNKIVEAYQEVSRMPV